MASPTIRGTGTFVGAFRSLSFDRIKLDMQPFAAPTQIATTSPNDLRRLIPGIIHRS
jgi:hypothetical protein